MLVNRLMRQSQQERRIAVQLMQVSVCYVVLMQEGIVIKRQNQRNLFAVLRKSSLKWPRSVWFFLPSKITGTLHTWSRDFDTIRIGHVACSWKKKNLWHTCTYTEHVFCLAHQLHFLLLLYQNLKQHYFRFNLTQIRHEKEVIRQNRWAALTRVMSS